MPANRWSFWLGWVLAFTVSGAGAGIIAPLVRPDLLSSERGWVILIPPAFVMTAVGICLWQMQRYMRNMDERTKHSLIVVIGSVITVTLVAVIGMVMVFVIPQLMLAGYDWENQEFTPLYTAYLLPVAVTGGVGFGIGAVCSLGMAILCLWERWRKRPVDAGTPAILVLIGGLIVGIMPIGISQMSPLPLISGILVGMGGGAMFALLPGWVVAYFWWRTPQS